MIKTVIEIVSDYLKENGMMGCIILNSLVIVKIQSLVRLWLTIVRQDIKYLRAMIGI